MITHPKDPPLLSLQISCSISIILLFNLSESALLSLQISYPITIFISLILWKIYEILLIYTIILMLTLASHLICSFFNSCVRIFWICPFCFPIVKSKHVYIVANMPKSLTSRFVLVCSLLYEYFKLVCDIPWMASTNSLVLYISQTRQAATAGSEDTIGWLPYTITCWDLFRNNC